MSSSIACVNILLGCHGGLCLALHTVEGRGASLGGDAAGAHAVVRARVAALAEAAVGSGVIHLRVDTRRAAGQMDGSVHQGERHTAALDHEVPPETSLQVGVLETES